MNIIGDIAGRYDELMELVYIIPKDQEIVLVGDLNDRGPKSKEVIEWAMTTPNVITLDSNHGHMFVDYYNGCEQYDPGDFIFNGGYDTLLSYGISPNYASIELEMKKNVPYSHIDFLNKALISYEKDNVFVSHAPWLGKGSRQELVWNRGEPTKMPGKLQVFGHNSHWGLRRFEDTDGLWAICIDTSKQGLLTCFNTVEDKVYQVPYK